jgi:hypothetical protein
MRGKNKFRRERRVEKVSGAINRPLQTTEINWAISGRWKRTCIFADG